MFINHEIQLRNNQFKMYWFIFANFYIDKKNYELFQKWWYFSVISNFFDHTLVLQGNHPLVVQLQPNISGWYFWHIEWEIPVLKYEIDSNIFTSFYCNLRALKVIFEQSAYHFVCSGTLVNNLAYSKLRVSLFCFPKSNFLHKSTTY